MSQKAGNEKRKTPEDAEWFWTKYCIVAAFVCFACIIMLPVVTRRADNLRDQLYGMGSAELGILRTGLGYDAELQYSMQDEIEKLQEECAALEAELAEEGEQ